MEFPAVLTEFLIDVWNALQPDMIAKARDQKKGSLQKGSFHLFTGGEESPESPKTRNSLQPLDNGRILLCFPKFGGSLESLNSLEPLENGLF